MLRVNGDKRLNKTSRGKEKGINKAELRASWKAWIEAQVNEGRNRTEAEEMAVIFQLCRIFKLSPEQFGIVFWPGGEPIGSTHKTGMILASLVLALIYERVDNPPVKFGAVTELLKTLPAEVQPV
jgi:hypothetical protein